MEPQARRREHQSGNATGTYTFGFILLAIFSLGCLAVNYFVFVKRANNLRASAASA